MALGGQSIQQAEQGAIGSEVLGITAAAIILLLTFGSVVAAGLPILVAIAGLAVCSMLTGLVIAFIDAPDWSTSLATMMGIGIGIDYALLMVTRFREWRAAGLDPEAATTATLDTAGRAVMVAGSTVVISMLGLFAMGLSFMRGAAVVTILAVLVVMAASVTLFPALLGYLGRHIDRLRLPIGSGASRRGRRRRPRRADRAAGCAGAGSSSATGWLAALLGVAILLAPRRAVPRRPVRLPRCRQQPRGHRDPHRLRPARRRVRPGRQRPAAARRRAARRCRSRVLDGVRRAAGDSRRRRRHSRHAQPGRRHRRPLRPADHRSAGRRAPRTWSTSCATS